MADKKISALTALAQGDVAVSTDVLPIVDTSATETKKIAVNALVGAAAAAGLTNVDINSGTIDGATIATSDITVGAGKTLNVSAGTLTLADNQISGDKVEGGTINAITINTLTSTAVNATTVDATNIEVTNLKAKDGTAAGSIADSTGVVTLASSVLTTTDINGGTIDGTAIGASSASTGAFSTISASGNLTLSGGTANGVLYLNGSKSATSGSALTFDGTTFVSANTQTGLHSMRVYNGSNASAGDGAGIQFGVNGSNIYGRLWTDNNSAAMYFDNLLSTPFIWRISGTSEQMRLNSTGLGIGTNSPAGKLHVVGDSLSNTFKLIANTTVSGSDATIFRPADNTMAFSTNGAERARIDSSGNLGIGTSSPGFKLDVNGVAAVRAGNAVRYYRTDNAIYTQLYDAGTNGFTLDNANGDGFRFQSNGTNQMVLSSSGNLGIGVTPPAWESGTQSINVGAGTSLWNPGSGTVTRLITNAYRPTAGNYTYRNNGGATYYEQSGSTHAWYNAGTGTAGNTISFTQAATLDANGNFMVGLTSSTHRLQAEVASGADRDIFMASVSGASNGFRIQWVNSTSKIHVNIQNLPTSSAGLPAGTLWNDSGTLKVA